MPFYVITDGTLMAGVQMTPIIAIIIQRDMDQSQAHKENIETFIQKKLSDHKKDMFSMATLCR